MQGWPRAPRELSRASGPSAGTGGPGPVPLSAQGPPPGSAGQGGSCPACPHPFSEVWDDSFFHTIVALYGASAVEGGRIYSFYTVHRISKSTLYAKFAGSEIAEHLYTLLYTAPFDTGPPYGATMFHTSAFTFPRFAQWDVHKTRAHCIWNLHTT